MFHNEIPKQFMFSDNYTQLIPENPLRDDTFPMFPRIGAFEVSTVLQSDQGQGDIMFFSKLMSACWPHTSTLASRISKCFEDFDAAGPQALGALKEAYQTTGVVRRQARRGGASSRLGTAASTFASNARGRTAQTA